MAPSAPDGAFGRSPAATTGIDGADGKTDAWDEDDGEIEAAHLNPVSTCPVAALNFRRVADRAFVGKPQPPPRKTPFVAFATGGGSVDSPS